MKRIFLLYCLLSLSTFIEAQESQIKPKSFGFQLSFIDFPTAQDLRKKSLGNVIESNDWSDIKRMDPALTLLYAKGLHPHVDLASRLTFAYSRYPFRNDKASAADDKLYTEADVNINLKLLTDRYFIVPYLQGGIGASMSQSTFMAQIPLGVGLQINIGKNNFINLNSNYRIPVTAPANYSLLHSIGILTTIEKEMPKVIPLPPPVSKPVVVDADGDSVVDSIDLCPDVAGVVDLKGCPDADKDGIADKDDRCPDQPGTAKYQGCPIPDNDKDGINNEIDKCPDVAGVERYEGCPVPDSDKDEVNDEEDKCPAIFGVKEEGGCPAIAYKVNNLFFALGSVTLNNKAKKELNLLAAYLSNNPDIKVLVEGHADNSGAEDINAKISMDRAQRASEYLSRKGVAAERIFAQGYSASNPLSDNSEEMGRAKNRRVEIKLKRN